MPGPDFESSIPFTFDCVSTQVGSLQVTAQDEFTLVSPGAPNLSNATVTVSDFLTGSNVATLVTGASGTVLFTNLTSAYYTINVEAPNHGGFSTTLLVQPSETNDVVAFLPDNLVTYSWVVDPTTIPDNYDFVLTTTFQTQVPWPVVTINPGAINLCQFGGTNQVDLVISNNGLISAQGLVRSGCMMAAAALGQSERVTEIRSRLKKGLTGSADIFAKRFEREIKAGRLTRTPSARVRGRLLVDLVQGLQLRAKVGITREELLQDARSYVPLILGK